MELNSKMLRHEANHYDRLIKIYPDLKLGLDETSFHYHSDLINHIANEIDYHNYNNSYLANNIYLKLEDCEICKTQYNKSIFAINTYTLPIEIFRIEFEYQNKNDVSINLLNYKDVLDKYNLNNIILNKIDLYILNFIKNNTNIIKMNNLNDRVKKLLPFI